MLRALMILLMTLSLLQVGYAKRTRVKSVEVAAKKILVAVDLVYKDPKAPEGSGVELQLKDDFKALPDDHNWVTLQNKMSEDPVIMLARLEKAEEKQVFLNFMIIATGDKPGLLAAPKMVLMYGQQGQMTVSNRNRKLLIKLNVVAK